MLCSNWSSSALISTHDVVVCLHPLPTLRLICLRAGLSTVSVADHPVHLVSSPFGILCFFFIISVSQLYFYGEPRSDVRKSVFHSEIWDLSFVIEYCLSCITLISVFICQLPFWYCVMLCTRQSVLL